MNRHQEDRLQSLIHSAYQTKTVSSDRLTQRLDHLIQEQSRSSSSESKKGTQTMKRIPVFAIVLIALAILGGVASAATYLVQRGEVLFNNQKIGTFQREGKRTTVTIHQLPGAKRTTMTVKSDASGKTLTATVGSDTKTKGTLTFRTTNDSTTNSKAGSTGPKIMADTK